MINSIHILSQELNRGLDLIKLPQKEQFVELSTAVVEYADLLRELEIKGRIRNIIKKQQELEEERKAQDTINLKKALEKKLVAYINSREVTKAEMVYQQLKEMNRGNEIKLIENICQIIYDKNKIEDEGFTEDNLKKSYERLLKMEWCGIGQIEIEKGYRNRLFQILLDDKYYKICVDFLKLIRISLAESYSATFSIHNLQELLDRLYSRSEVNEELDKAVNTFQLGEYYYGSFQYFGFTIMIRMPEVPKDQAPTEKNKLIKMKRNFTNSSFYIEQMNKKK